MSGSEPEIRPLELEARGLEELAELLRGAFPRARHVSAAYLEWNYLRNPEGLAFAYNAYVDGRLVAHCAATPLRARVDGAEERGLEMQHAATRPEHAGRGLFKELAERSVQAAVREGFGFAVAPSNAKSSFAFVERLGFQMVEPFEVRIGVGPVPRGGAGAGFQFERVWTREALDWRLSRPDHPYRALRRGEDLVILASGGVPGLQVEVGTFPAAQVARPLPEGRVGPVRVWIGLDPSRRWTGRPFLNLPVRLRPSPLNFIFRDLTGRGRLLETGRVRADMLDYDAF